MADPRFINPLTILPDIGGITIDKTKRLSEKYSNVITSNPIEGTASVSDHKYREPTMITILGELVDTPSTNLTGAFTSVLGIAKTKFDRLLALAAGQNTFSIMDGIHRLSGFQFEEIELTKENPRYSIEFTATMKQVIQVQSSILSFADFQNTLERIAFIAPVFASTGSIASVEVEPFGVLL
jgi:hypothetical protein